MSVALSLYARDHGEVNIAFLMALYPMLDDRMTSASMKDNDAPGWDEVSNRQAWEHYLKGIEPDQVSKYAAPGRETDYRGLPPTFSFVGSIEPFLDETLTYVANLVQAKVPTYFRVYDGCFHAFDAICSRSQVAKDATAFMMETYQYAVTHYFAVQPKSFRK
jgi:acetyl esterase/lipase